MGEPSWPSPHITSVVRRLTRHGLSDPVSGTHATPESAEYTEFPEGEGTGGGEGLSVQSPLSVGQFGGKWASCNAPPDLPYDQREEDGGSLVFQTEPLTERTEILGSPCVELDLSVSEPVAMVAARLSDVAPDGSATRVSYGLLNLTRSETHGDPRPLEPGRRYRAVIPLNGVAQAFPPGHRIRVSLATSYWPLAWPPPKPVLLTVYETSSTLTLPVRPVAEPDALPDQPFGEPEGTRPRSPVQLVAPEERWQVKRDLVDYAAELEIVKDRGTVRLEDIGLDVGRRAYERYTSVAEDFTSATGESAWTMTFRRDDWDVRVETRTVLSCDEDQFRVDATLDGYEGDRRVFSRTWNETVPRDLL